MTHSTNLRRSPLEYDLIRCCWDTPLFIDFFSILNLSKIQSVFAQIFHFRYFEDVLHLRSSSFSIWERYNQCLLSYSTFKILKVVFISRWYSIFVWSPEIKFKTSAWSNQWLLSYSTFNFLKSSTSKAIFNFGLVP